MNKKEYIFPFLFIGLSASFSVVCVAVFLTKGKSQKWISRKMKIGGLLLSISIVSSGCFHGKVIVSDCYVSMVDTIPVDTVKPIIEEAQVAIEKNIIKGNIPNDKRALSYLLSDSIGQTFQTGRLVNGFNYNQNSGDFEILLDKNPEIGKYEFRIYNCPIDMQLTERPERILFINVKNE